MSICLDVYVGLLHHQIVACIKPCRSQTCCLIRFPAARLLEVWWDLSHHHQANKAEVLRVLLYTHKVLTSHSNSPHLTLIFFVLGKYYYIQCRYCYYHSAIVPCLPCKLHIPPLASKRPDQIHCQCCYCKHQEKKVPGAGCS